ncbi:hypothetical protein NLJ89_g9341 [Agrocybe chaxingu]|uniref:Uncharacterized protein n=1 Tax=Agrocybe chaxingu TaxID=84603 RepID=A0A9W8MRB7_9AGAR|nr:hypothetical protein NLJ89_g9341 [Agrocybe chaxingu]
MHIKSIQMPFGYPRTIQYRAWYYSGPKCPHLHNTIGEIGDIFFLKDTSTTPPTYSIYYKHQLINSSSNSSWIKAKDVLGSVRHPIEHARSLEYKIDGTPKNFPIWGNPRNDEDRKLYKQALEELNITIKQGVKGFLKIFAQEGTLHVPINVDNIAGNHPHNPIVVEELAGHDSSNPIAVDCKLKLRILV